MQMNEEQIKPAFSIRYLGMDGSEIGIESPVDQVSDVEVHINIGGLVDNTDLGTAILKGFMDERKEEFVRLVNMIRAKKRSQGRILVPGKPELKLQ